MSVALRRRIPTVPLRPVDQSLRNATDPLAMYREAQQSLGDVFRFDFLRMPPTVVFCHADAVRELRDAWDVELEAQGPTEAFAARVFGPTSFMFADDARHAAEHAACTHALSSMNHPQHGARARMFEVACEEAARIPRRGELPLLRWLNRVNARMIVEGVFGVQGQLGEALVDATTAFMDWSASPENWMRGGDAELAELERTLLPVVAESRYRTHAPFVGIGEALDGPGTATSQRLLRDLAMTVLLPGIASGAIGAAWLVHLLIGERFAHSRRIIDSLRAFTAATRLDDVPELGAAIDETLRLYPPVLSALRRTPRAIDVCGHRVEPGNLIAVALPLLHRHPQYWQDADRVDVQRDFDAARKRGWYLPFGFGSRRNCVGKVFAHGTQIPFLVAALTRATGLRLSHPAGYSPRVVRRGANLAPSGDLPVVLS